MGTVAGICRHSFAISHKRRLSDLKRKVIRALLIAVTVVLLIAGVILSRADLYIRFWQKKGMVTGKVNSFEPEGEVGVKDLNSGIRMTENVAYGTQYPNSFLDIYQEIPDTEEKRPVFFYIHGGGYAWGDKAEGDPTAGKKDVEEATEYLQEICKSGYHVVSVNYALSPEYVYPIPIYQIDEAVRFLKEHQEEYRLDMSRVVFSGGSAGGQLAGQYVNIQTNQTYAKQMEMPQSLTKEEITGVVLSCALLQPSEFGSTGDWMTDIMFSRLGNVYFGKEADILEEADVILQASGNFPKTYLTDGNHGTFDRQADAFTKKLEELGVPFIYNTYPKEDISLGHGYDSYLEEPHAQDNLEKILAFLQDL